MISQNDGPRNDGQRRHRGDASELSQRLVREQFSDIVARNFDDAQPKIGDTGRLSSERFGGGFDGRIYDAAQPTTGRSYGPRDWPASDEVIALEDAESHFTPPQPTNVLATADPVRRLAVIGAIGAPALALVLLILRTALGAHPLIMGAAIFCASAFVVSLVVLFMKMPKDKPHDADDGAVV